jgi:hypothetical protein
MGKKNRRIRAMPLETWMEKKLCPFCRGSDGGKKEIYDSPEDAMAVAEYIKKERGTDLKVYQCPYETGWHLTKDNAADDTENRMRSLLQNNDIPLSSMYEGKVKWEYVEEENTHHCGAYAEETDSSYAQKSTPGKPVKPIVRVNAKESRKSVSLEGRVMEIVNNINIENIFKIDLNNLFSASLAKDFLDGEYQQITVHTAHNGTNRTDSYTVLVKKTFMQKHKIKKDDAVNIVVSGRCINSKTVWRCDRIRPYP